MIKKFVRVGILALACALAPLTSKAQAVSQTNTVYPAQNFTASAQTGSTIQLGDPAGNGGSFSVGNITVTGTALSTVTFGINGSADGGRTFFPLSINAINVPATTATTETATTGGVYQVNLAGITQIQIVTSGTFTATNVRFTVTAAPAGIIARNGGGGSGGTCGTNNIPCINVDNIWSADQTLNNAQVWHLLSPNGDFIFGASTNSSGNNQIALNVNDVADLNYNTVSLWGFWNQGNGSGGGVSVGQNGMYALTNTNDSFSGTVDTTISKFSPGIVQIGSGTTRNASGSLRLTNLTLLGACTGCTSTYSGITATGLVNVLAATLPATLGTPTQAQLIGIPITVTANLSTTATNPTLNINTLGAIVVTKCGTTALANGDINLNDPFTVVYNGTNYILQTPHVGICQTQTAGGLQAGPTGTASFSASGYFSASAGSSATLGVSAGSSVSAEGSAVLVGGNNSSTGAAGNSVLRPGQNTGGGVQGFAQVQQSFTTASPLAATFEAVVGTSTNNVVAAAGLGAFNILGIAQTVGGTGTGTAVLIVSHGKTTARFDGTPVVGDVACYPPPTTGTAGLLHDNATTACTTSPFAGVVTDSVSGTGSGATATVELH